MGKAQRMGKSVTAFHGCRRGVELLRLAVISLFGGRARGNRGAHQATAALTRHVGWEGVGGGGPEQQGGKGPALSQECEEAKRRVGGGGFVAQEVSRSSVAMLRV